MYSLAISNREVVGIRVCNPRRSVVVGSRDVLLFEVGLLPPTYSRLVLPPLSSLPVMNEGSALGSKLVPSSMTARHSNHH